MTKNDLLPGFSLEDSYCGIVAGVDEAGRGAIFGPIVAAAVVVDRDCIFEGVNDSKLLSQVARCQLFEKITSKYKYAISVVSSLQIDQGGIQLANIQACVESVQNLNVLPDHVLVDGNLKIPGQKNFSSIIKGDRISYSIAAASIVAKVYRDGIITLLAKKYPQYGLSQNKGYGTKEHILAVEKYGLTEFHRKSFKLKLPQKKLNE